MHPAPAPSSPSPIPLVCCASGHAGERFALELLADVAVLTGPDGGEVGRWDAFDVVRRLRRASGWVRGRCDVLCDDGVRRFRLSPRDARRLRRYIRQTCIVGG